MTNMETEIESIRRIQRQQRVLLQDFQQILDRSRLYRNSDMHHRQSLAKWSTSNSAHDSQGFFDSGHFSDVRPESPLLSGDFSRISLNSSLDSMSSAPSAEDFKRMQSQLIRLQQRVEVLESCQASPPQTRSKKTELVHLSVSKMMDCTERLCTRFAGIQLPTNQSMELQHCLQQQMHCLQDILSHLEIVED